MYVLFVFDSRIKNVQQRIQKVIIILHSDSVNVEIANNGTENKEIYLYLSVFAWKVKLVYFFYVNMSARKLFFLADNFSVYFKSLNLPKVLFESAS